MKAVKLFILGFVLFTFMSLGLGDAYGGSVLDGIRTKRWILTVYGGYDAAYQAWLKVGLLFGSGYKFLFAGIAVLAALIGFYALLIRLYTGARTGFASWGIPILIGCVLYVVLVVPPRGGMHEVVIYDKFYNKYSPPISNIPPILAMAAGIMNYIEDNSIGLFDTSVSMLEKYEYNPGGFAFLFVSNAFYDIADALVGANFLENVNYFLGDCIIKWAYGTGRISAEDLLKDSFNNILTKGSSDAFYTKYRTSTDIITLTCKEAAGRLTQDYNSLLSNLSSGVLPNRPEVRALCSAYGFDANNNVALRKCVDILNEGMRSLVYKGIDTSDIIGPLVVHKKFGDLLFSYVGSGGSALTPGVITATQTTTSSFIGAMIHANSWIPAIKETMRAFSVVIAPIVLLFIVTPLFGRALGVIFGMQIWLLLWAVIDVVITGFSLSLVRSIGQSGSMLCPGCGPNVIELTAFPSMAMKVYAILGMMRWAGIGLATFISGMLIRFGGTVLAMVAGQIAGAPMGAGSQAGVSGIKDPHGYVGSELVPRMAFTNAAFEVGGFRAYAMGRIAGATFMEASGVSSGLQTMTHTGGSFSGVASAGLSAGTIGATQNIASAVQGSILHMAGGPGVVGTNIGKVDALNKLTSAGAGEKLSIDDVLRLSSILGEAKAGSMEGRARYLENLAKQLNTSVYEIARLENLVGDKISLSSSQVKELIKKLGQNQRLSPELAELLDNIGQFVVKNVTLDPSGNIRYATLEGGGGGIVLTITPAGVELKSKVDNLKTKIGDREYSVKGEKTKLYNIHGQPVGYLLSGIFTDPISDKPLAGQVTIDPSSGRVVNSNLRSLLEEKQFSPIDFSLGTLKISSSGVLMEVLGSTDTGQSIVRMKGPMSVNGITMAEGEVIGIRSSDGSFMPLGFRSISPVGAEIKAITASPEILKKMAEDLRKSGFKELASRFEMWAKEGLPVVFELETDSRGQIARIKAVRGGKAEYMDLREDVKGKLIKSLNLVHSQAGSLSEYYNLTKRELGNLVNKYIDAVKEHYGPSYYHSGVLPAAMILGDPEILTKVYKNSIWRDQNLGFSLVQEVAGLLSKHGKITYKDLLKLGILPSAFGIGGGVDWSRTVTREELYYALEHFYRQLYDNKVLTAREKNKMFVEKINELYRELDPHVREKIYKKFIDSMADFVRIYSDMYNKNPLAAP